MNITMKEAAKAWGEGKEVEWSNVYQFGGKWQPIAEQGFYFNNGVQYRLKPEVTKSLERALATLKTLVEDCGDPKIDAEALKVLTSYIKDTQK